jgi:hypothetical protein
MGDAEDAALAASLKAHGQDTPVILEAIAGRQPPAYRIKDGLGALTPCATSAPCAWTPSSCGPARPSRTSSP